MRPSSSPAHPPCNRAPWPHTSPGGAASPAAVPLARPQPLCVARPHPIAVARPHPVRVARPHPFFRGCAAATASAHCGAARQSGSPMQHYPPVPCTASQPQTSAALAAAQPAGIVWPSGVSQRPALGRAVGCFATSERSGNSDSGSGDGTVGGGDGGDGDRHGAVAGHREAQTSFRFAVPCAGAHGGALSLAATLLEPAPGAPARGTAAGGGGGGAAGSVAAGTAADPDAAPVAILCHGFASSKEAPLLDAIARRLSEEVRLRGVAQPQAGLQRAARLRCVRVHAASQQATSQPRGRGISLDSCCAIR
eukprot:354058-Chlamydomonas_euryale.AAC.15